MTVEVQVSDVKFSKINFTESAKQHVLTYLTRTGSKGVRMSVKKTGCSGLSYVIDYVDAPSQDDVILDLDDTHVICIEKKSFPYLKGLKVDYVKEGLNHKFVFNNPNQTGQCGCGESFTVE